MGTRQDQTLGTDIRRNNSFLELFTFSVSLSSMKNNEMLALFTSTVLFLFDHVQPILSCQLAIVAQTSHAVLLIYYYIHVTANGKTLRSQNLLIDYFISLWCRHPLGLNIRDFDDLGVQAATGWRELCRLKHSKMYT